MGRCVHCLSHGHNLNDAMVDVFPYFTKSVVLATPDAAARGPKNVPLYKFVNHICATQNRYPNEIVPSPASYPESDASKAPLPISFSKYVFDYSATLRSAFNYLGYPNATDFNAGKLNGVQVSISYDQKSVHSPTVIVRSIDDQSSNRSPIDFPVLHQQRYQKRRKQSARSTQRASHESQL